LSFLRQTNLTTNYLKPFQKFVSLEFLAMPSRASSYNWEFDPDWEAFSQLFTANAECDNQLLLESSDTDHPWSPSNKGSFSDPSASLSLQSSISNSFPYDCMDWNFLCGTQPGTAAQWLPYSVQPCDAGHYTSDATHDDFQSACAFTNSASNGANSSTFANFSTSSNRAISANDMQSFPTVADASNSNLPIIQEIAAVTPKTSEKSQSPATDAKPPCKRARPRKIRATSDPSLITSFSVANCASRVPHSQVEKKYREGLNTSLQHLQRAVPTLPQPVDRAVGTARPSKGMVIAGAIDYIRRIEKERDEALQKVRDCRC
jgi:hypothetical protein